MSSSPGTRADRGIAARRARQGRKWRDLALTRLRSPDRRSAPHWRRRGRGDRRPRKRPSRRSGLRAAERRCRTLFPRPGVGLAIHAGRALRRDGGDQLRGQLGAWDARDGFNADRCRSRRRRRRSLSRFLRWSTPCLTTASAVADARPSPVECEEAKRRGLRRRRPSSSPPSAVASPMTSAALVRCGGRLSRCPPSPIRLDHKRQSHPPHSLRQQASRWWRQRRSERRFRGFASAAVTGCAIGVASGLALGGLRFKLSEPPGVLPDTSPVSVSLASTSPLAAPFSPPPPWPPWASAETVAKMT